jgi:aryl-alcohol dehydrogenase-like predicted oxidoreductase
MSESIRRRTLLKQIGAGVAGGALVEPLLRAETPASRPAADSGNLARRTLGRTGVQVPILSFGTAPMGHAFYETEPFEKVIYAALEAGIIYLDTAPLYDVAQERLAPILAKRRKDIFLVTKAWSRSKDEALKSLAKSIETMGVDHVDLCHLHNVGQYTHEEALGKEGLLAGVLEAKKRGWTRFIGCSGHAQRDRWLPVIETDEIDVVMPAMNFVDRHTYNFEEQVLPTARKHRCGIVCMKVYGGVTGGWDGYKKRRPGRLAQSDDLRQDAVDYALSIPGVATCVIGMKTLDELRLTLEAVRKHKPLEGDRRRQVLARGEQMAREWKDHFGPVTA